MIEVELFDGTILEFPQGTDPAVIDRVAKEQTAQRRTAAAPPTPPGVDAATGAPMAVPPPSLDVPASPAPAEEPSLVDTIMDGAGNLVRRGGYLAQEFTRGATNMLGAPVDLLNVSPMLLNILPGEQGMGPISENPVGGSASIRAGVNAPRDVIASMFGYAPGDLEPQDRFDRIAGRVAQEFGAMSVPAVGMTARAQALGTTGTRAMQESSSGATRFAGRALEPYAVNPARTLARDGMFAAAAGTGAGIGREMAPEGSEDTYDLIGAILGTGGAALGAGSLNTAVNAAKAATGRTDDVVREAAARSLAEGSNAPVTPSGARDTTGLARDIAEGPRIGATVPGFRETTADVTQNPGLAAAEYSRSAGPNAGEFTMRRQQNAQAAGQAINEMAPDATPGEFSGALRQRREENFQAVDQNAQANVRAAQDEFERTIRDLEAAEAGRVSAVEESVTKATRAADDARARLTPATSAEARGSEIRTALDAALGAARKVETEAWSAVRGTVDPAPLASAFDGVTNSLTQSERRVVADMGGAISTPGQLAPDTSEDAALIAQVFGDAPAAEATDLAEITTLRSEFTSAIRQAEGAGDVNKARILNKYVAAIDAYIDQFDDVRDAVAKARAVSRDLNDRFTRRGDPIADTLASRPSGGPVIPSSDVARRFVQPDEGQTSVTDRLLAETDGLPDAPPVRPALADQIRAETQGMSPDQITRYTAERQRMMQLFPDLQGELETAAATGRTARDAQRTAADETRAAARERTQGTREAQRALTDRERAETARVEETRAALYDGRGNDPRAIVGRYLEFGDERADDAMARIVNDADPARAVEDLMNFVGDNPRAVEGAKAAFWRLMERTARSSGVSTRTPGGQQSWKFESLHNFLNDPQTRAVAERLYRDDPEHLGNLQTLSETLRAANFGQTGRAAGTSGTAQGLLGSEILPSTETVASRAFAFQRGQVGMGFLATNMGSIILRRAMLKGRTQEFNRLVDAALLDPDLAQSLVTDYNPANLAALRRSATIHFGVRVAQLDDLLADEGEDDEVMNAIGAPEVNLPGDPMSPENLRRFGGP